MSHEMIAKALVDGCKRYVDSRFQSFTDRLVALEARPIAKDGVGIAGLVRDHEGCLILTLSDGKALNAGTITGPRGEAGLDGKDGKDGINGDDGRHGRDGTSVDAKEIAQAVKTEIEAEVRNLVDAAVADLPPAPAAKDPDYHKIDVMIGQAVKKQFDSLEIPKDGKDGVGLVNALIDRVGHLMITLSDGTVHDLGLVIGIDGKDGAAGLNGTDGINGKDGKDGLSFDDFNFVVDYDGERTVTLKWSNRYGKEITRSFTLPVMIWRGVYHDGESYKRGDTVTWGGSLWHAQEDTSAKPGDGAKEWKLAVKRGRDGKDGKDVQPGNGTKDNRATLAQ